MTNSTALQLLTASQSLIVWEKLCFLQLGPFCFSTHVSPGDPLSSQNSMNLPPDKARLLRQYDNEKKWDLICDQVREMGVIVR